MLLLSALLLSPVVLGATVPRQANSEEPCAELIHLYTSAAKPGDPLSLPNAQLAQDCLSSIPFRSDLAATFLDEFRKYLNFQSTIEILKNPPDTYLSKAVDLLGGLDTIEEKATAEKYASHYDFETEVSQLIKSANDGHLSVSLCTQGIFTFSAAPYWLASVSATGTDVPELYLGLNGTLIGDDKPSIVAKINGQSAADYLNPITELQGSQDPDARYNNLFPSYARAGAGATAIAPGSFSKNEGLWPGSDTIDVELEDGSTISINVTVGVIINNPDAITDAESLFDAYCIPSTTSDASSSTASSAETETPVVEPPETQPAPSDEPAAPVAPTYETGPLGYPKPEVRDGYNQVNGFYLDDETAVLFIPDFNGPEEGAPTDIDVVVSQLCSDFVQNATASGHDKLIIDLSGNGGGNIIRAFTLFNILFPEEFAYSATRFRRHPAANILSKVLGAVNQTTAAEGPLNYAYQGAVTPDQESDFPDLSSYLTENVEHDVPVSVLHANFNYTAVSSERMPIWGYGPYSDNNKTTPYKAEDILIVTDGYCASTCTTFVNLMTNVGGVRSLAFGGRPQAEPMQIMGGVRGGQAAQAAAINSYFETGLTVLQEYPDILDTEEQTLVNKTAPMPLATWPIIVNGLGVNLRNAYQEGDDNLPLQFQYQAADCRLFFTLENYIEPATMWAAAKKAIWGGGSCVEGSTGGKGSLDNRGSNSSAGSGNRPDEETVESGGNRLMGSMAHIVAVVMLGLVFIL